MRLRIAGVLAVAVWLVWAAFFYQAPPNAMPACVSNGPLACSTIDGFPLGTLVQDCGGQPDVCGDDAQMALDGLPPWESLHPAVVHSSKYTLDMARLCGPVVCTLSGEYTIYVFEFTDGSHHAIGVSCGIDGRRAVQTHTAGSAS